jgi:hypothetical protein
MLQFQLHTETYTRWELLHADGVIAAVAATVSVCQLTADWSWLPAADSRLLELHRNSLLALSPLFPSLRQYLHPPISTASFTKLCTNGCSNVGYDTKSGTSGFQISTNEQSEIQGWAKVGLQLWVRETQTLFLYYYLFIYYCIIYLYYLSYYYYYCYYFVSLLMIYLF